MAGQFPDRMMTPVLSLDERRVYNRSSNILFRQFTATAMVFGLAATVILADKAIACSCAQPAPAEERFAAASVVFVGELIDKESACVPDWPQDPSFGWTVPRRGLTFRVVASWKGITGSQVGAQTWVGGQSCGFTGDIGTVSLFYAGTDSDTGELLISLCSVVDGTSMDSDVDALDALVDRIELVDDVDPNYPPVPFPPGPCGLGALQAIISSMLGMAALRSSRRRFLDVRLCYGHIV